MRILVLFLTLLVATPVLAQETTRSLSFNSLEEVEEFVGTDLPDDFDWQNFDPVQLGPGFRAPAVGAPSGTVNCFDYYKFNSVDIGIRNEFGVAQPGDEQEFVVTLTNNNPYPLIDGKLYIKVFRARADNIDTQINGDHIIDSFVALEDLNLKASSTSEHVFRWTPPRYLPSGEYYAAGYFITADRFNLAGLSFTDDIIGGMGDFVMEGGTAAFYLDKDNVTFDGAAYQFIGAPPRVNMGKPVKIEVPIKNETAEDGVGMVHWKVYYWDAQREEHLIETTSEAIMVPAGGSATLSYRLTDKQHAVYLVSPSLVYRGEIVSKLDIRFVRMGIDEPRINFPALTTFPLEAGKEATVFSCLHNSGTNPLVQGTALELVLTDTTGIEVHRVSYEGDTSGAMMAIAEGFTPDKNYNYLTLTATLTKDGQVADEVSVVYDCNEIDPDACLEIVEEEAEGDDGGSLLNFGKAIWIGLGIFSVLLIAGFVFYVVRRTLPLNNNNVK